MPIRPESRDGATVLHIDGDMTIYNAAPLKAELLPHLAQGGEHEIDLAGVSEIDTAGLQLLILAKREAARRNTTLRLSGHSRAVLEVLDLCNLAAFFGDPVLLAGAANH